MMHAGPRYLLRVQLFFRYYGRNMLDCSDVRLRPALIAICAIVVLPSLNLRASVAPTTAAIDAHLRDMDRVRAWRVANNPPPPADVVHRLEEWVQANPDDIRAALYLAQIYSSPECGPTRFADAARLEQRAADANLSEAKAMLGLKYILGDGVKADRDRGLRMIKEALDAKDPRAHAYLGVFFARGDVGFPQDFEKARRAFQFAADRGVDKAGTDLGQLIATVGPDKQEGVAKVEAAAANGFPGAKILLAQWYVEGKIVPRDAEKGFECMREAAVWGDPEAQCYLSDYYEDGTGTQKNPQLALEWSRRAASLGYAPAEQRMGEACLTARYGAAWNQDEGIQWITRAAEHGQRSAQEVLGVMYLSGLLVKRDEEAGRRWLSRAAEGGSGAGKLLLAWSDGGAQTESQMQKLREEAQTRDKTAEAELGIAYLCGTGVERNRKVARELLKRSSDDGEPLAAKLLELLAHSPD